MRACAERALALALIAGAAACAPESSHPVVGDASGSFDTEIFLPGSSPPNTGDGAIVVTLDDRERTLAQSAASFAVDGSGNQTLDPDQATFFGIQVLQYVSEDVLEVFEIRVLPASWVADTEIPFDGVTAVGFFGTVEFDANGNAIDATVKASTTGGSLLLGDAGRDPRASVTGSFADVTLAAE